jgi:hypothetical protein
MFFIFLFLFLQKILLFRQSGGQSDVPPLVAAMLPTVRWPRMTPSVECPKFPIEWRPERCSPIGCSNASDSEVAADDPIG